MKKCSFYYRRVIPEAFIFNVGIFDEHMKSERVSESIVFKESISKLSKSMDDFISILNKDGEEVQNFGIMPDGEVCGQEITKKTLNDVVMEGNNAGYFTYS